jgi:hypothetical protein
MENEASEMCDGTLRWHPLPSSVRRPLTLVNCVTDASRRPAVMFALLLSLPTIIYIPATEWLTTLSC